MAKPRARRCGGAAVVLALGSLLCLAQPARAACGHDGVRISAAVERHAAICAALDDVVGYFAGIGLAIEPVVSIELTESVVLPLVDAGGASVDLRVLGAFDPSQGAVRVTDPDVDPALLRAPWGIGWSEDLALSVLRHELAHMAIHAVLGREACRLGCAWHEFIAYAVQIDLMPPALRAEIERGYAEATGFERMTEVNAFTLFFDPDRFAVNAWRTAGAHGGRAFVAALLRGDSGIATGEILWTR